MHQSWLSLILTLLVLSSCQRCGFQYCVEDAEEFVIDSYQIRQGKLSIKEMQGDHMGELPLYYMQEYKDVIAEDDILNIAAYHPTRVDLMKSIEYINQAVGFKVVNGSIDLTDIAPVHVEGLTLDEARSRLELAYRDQIQDIELFISYKDRLARKVELTGMVSTSSIPVDGKIRLYEILSKAKVPSQANLYKSYLVRDHEQLPVDFHRLMVEGDMTQNVVMRGGDRIYIANPSESRVIVMGEVLKPTAVDLPHGSISLREALVMAGGIPFTGDKSCIQVIRGSLVSPKIYQLSWEHIIHLPNESLLLIAGDTVYISEKPITKWNRFISQLLPSFGGVQTGMSTYRLFVP